MKLGQKDKSKGQDELLEQMMADVSGAFSIQVVHQVLPFSHSKARH